MGYNVHSIFPYFFHLPSLACIVFPVGGGGGGGMGGMGGSGL